MEVALTGTLDTNAAEVNADVGGTSAPKAGRQLGKQPHKTPGIHSEADSSACSAYVCELRDELLRGRERCCAATSLKIDYAVTHLNIDSIMCACVDV